MKNRQMRILVRKCFPDNPGNPARVDMTSGTIEINKEMFSILPDYTQRFILYHEAAHYVLKTYDECKADDYALKRMAFKQAYSLKHHIDSVYMLARDDVRRKRHALLSVLTLAAANGSEEALNLINKYRNG
jgi:hypothetical protein